MSTLTTIGFDADDTLWQHERFYQLTQQRFTALLRPYADPHHLDEHMMAAERRNISALRLRGQRLHPVDD